MRLCTWCARHFSLVGLSISKNWYLCFFFFRFLVAETSRISSRGKGTVYNTGGGGRLICKRPVNDKITTLAASSASLLLSDVVVITNRTSYRSGFHPRRSEDYTACMIIEDQPPQSIRPRQNLHQDTTQRFQNHLVLPKHRTTKFSR